MRNKAKIAIIQTTRIGDVIQTSIAANQLKKENPNVELILITRRKFAQGLEFLTKKTFDKIYYFDLKDFISNDSSLDESVNKLDSFFDEINSNSLNLVVNFSFSKSSSYIASKIKAPNRLGLYRNKKNQVCIDDQWSQFVYSNVMNGDLNPYNLVDIFKFTLGAKETDLASHFTTEDHIVIHPFASHSKKMWSTNYWTEVVYKVLKANPEVSITIVGAKNDLVNATAIKESNSLKSFEGRIQLLIGESLEKVYKKVSSAKLLICHDSMVSHLAAINSVPTIVISLGVVRPNETTPYHNNVLNLVPRRSCFPCKIETSCALLPCHKDISVSAVSTIANGILENETLDQDFLIKRIPTLQLDSFDIYHADFNNGFMQLHKLKESTPTESEVMTSFYRIIWSYFLKEQEVVDDIPALNNNVMSVLYNHREGVSYLFELINFGMKFTNEIIKEINGINYSQENVSQSMNKLGEIDRLMQITKNTYPLLQPVIDYFYVAKANMSGHSAKDTFENNLILYYSLNNMCKVVYDLITSCIGNANMDDHKKQEV
jgi:ADP-heptose:LPS heptosyltransferase